MIWPLTEYAVQESGAVNSLLKYSVRNQRIGGHRFSIISLASRGVLATEELVDHEKR